MVTLLAESLIEQNTNPADGALDIPPVSRDVIPTHLIHGTIQIGKTAIQYTAQFPEARIYDGYATIEPGFGGFKQTSRGLRNSLAEAGIASATYGPVREDDYGLWARLTNSQEAHARTVTAVTEALATNSEVRRSMPGGDQIDFHRQLHVPHSMGKLAITPHAKDNHSKVDAIIDLATVGYGSPTPLQLAETIPKGISHAIWHEFIPYITSGELALSPINLARIIHYYARNPARTAGEMIACLRADVRPDQEEIRNNGVKTAYIAFRNDCLVPPDDSIADHVDLYSVMPNTGHMAPQVKAKEVAGMVIDSLRELHIGSTVAK